MAKKTKRDNRARILGWKPKPKVVLQQLLFYKLIFMKQFTKCFHSQTTFSHMLALGRLQLLCDADACTNIAQIAVQSKQRHCQFTYCNATAPCSNRKKIPWILAKRQRTAAARGCPGMWAVEISPGPQMFINFIEQLIKCGKMFCHTHSLDRPMANQRRQLQTMQCPRKYATRF